jgi:hypothetical protein
MKQILGKPAVLAIVILGIVTASGLLLRSNTGSANPPQSSETAENAPKAVGTRIAAEIPQISDAAKPGDTPKASEPPRTRESAKATARHKIGGSEDMVEHRQLLETIGALTAAHCYQSYLNISLLNDGRAKGVYTEKEAARLLDSVLSVLDSVDRKLAALGKINLYREDHDSLEQMRELSDLLRRQGGQLQAFWDSGKEADAAKYEAVRKDSWAAISRLMGTDR